MPMHSEMKNHRSLLERRAGSQVLQKDLTIALIRDKILNLSNIKHFILDECDKLLDSLGTHAILRQICEKMCKISSELPHTINKS